MFLAPSAAAQLEQAAPAVHALRAQHPMFGWACATAHDLHGRSREAVDLKPAPSKPTDAQGLLTVAKEGAAGCVQVRRGMRIEAGLTGGRPLGFSCQPPTATAQPPPPAALAPLHCAGV